MKIAVLLYGQPRTYDWAFPHYKEFLLDKHDCDVFMHLWKNTDRRGVDGDTSDQELEKFYSGFQPVKSKVIDQISSFEDRDWKNQDLELWQKAGIARNDYWIFKICSQFYSLMACNDMRKEYEAETGVKYDCVVKVRTDVRPKADCAYELGITNTKVMSFAGFRYYGGMSDHYAWGSTLAMDTYCNFYNGIFEMLANNPRKQVGIETMQRDWMQMNGFKVMVHQGKVSLYAVNKGDIGG